MNEPKIGVLVATARQQSELNQLVLGAGYQLAASLVLAESVSRALPEADLWLVSLDLQDPEAEKLVDQLDARGVPVIFDEGEGSPQEAGVMPGDARAKREKQLAAKLRELVREPESAKETQRRRAEWVWVLAASAGGPEAVVQFLRAIPAQLQGVAFLYVQHIDQAGIPNLQRVISRHSPWPVEQTDIPRIIREKTVYLVAPKERIDLSENGVLAPANAPWAGRFKPCIDQVIAKVARVYGAHGGAIVFSGMADDGARSSVLLHHLGGRVWVQAPSTCAVDSMPTSVQARGCAQLAAAPAELAEQMVRLYLPKTADEHPLQIGRA